MVVDDVATASPATTAGAPTPWAHTPPGPDGPLTCGIYDIPTLESGGAPRSTLLDGLPYVVVCDDASGEAVLSEVFVYRVGR